MSEVPHPSVIGPQGAGRTPSPPPGPTQIAFPGQVQPAHGSQHAQHLQAGPRAVGFPNYVAPPPSPKNRTGLVVGMLVVVVTILLAVLGFWLVS